MNQLYLWEQQRESFKIWIAIISIEGMSFIMKSSPGDEIMLKVQGQN